MAQGTPLLRKLLVGYGTSEAIAKGLNIALTLGLATFVDVRSYGIIAILIAIELVLTELILLGQHTVQLRYHESFKSAISKLYSSSLALILAAACTILILYLAFSQQILDITGVNVQARDFCLLIVGIAMQCHISLYLAYLRSEDKVLEYGVIRIGYQVAKILAVICMAIMLNHASAYPIGIFIANITILLTLAPIINRNTQGYTKISRVSSPTIKQNLLMGLPLTAHALIGVINSTTDRFIINKTLAPEQLAVYNFAFTQGTAIFFILNILSLAYVPLIYRNQAYNNNAKKLLLDYYKISTLGAILLSIIIYFIVYPLSLSFVDENYSTGGIIVALALLSVIIRPISQVGIYKLTLLGDVNVIPLATLVCLGANICFNLTFIPKFGITGAAIAVLLSEAIYGLITLILSSTMAARRLKTS